MQRTRNISRVTENKDSCFHTQKGFSFLEVSLPLGSTGGFYLPDRPLTSRPPRVVNNTFEKYSQYQYQYFLVLLKQYKYFDRSVFNINHAVSKHKEIILLREFSSHLQTQQSRTTKVTTLPDAEKLAFRNDRILRFYLIALETSGILTKLNVWMLPFCSIKVMSIGINRNELPIFIMVLPIPIQCCNINNPASPLKSWTRPWFWVRRRRGEMFAWQDSGTYTVYRAMTDENDKRSLRPSNCNNNRRTVADSEGQGRPCPPRSPDVQNIKYKINGYGLAGSIPSCPKTQS